jgi:hypothetical protein
LGILAGQTLTQLEEKAAAAAAALKAATGIDEKPAITTTKTTKTTTTVETVVVTTGGEGAAAVEAVVPPATKGSTVRPKENDDDDDDSVSDNSLNLDPLENPSDGSLTQKKGLKDPADRGSVYLGLRVYTNRDAPAVLGGQLRHEMATSFAGLALADV